MVTLLGAGLRLGGMRDGVALGLGWAVAGALAVVSGVLVRQRQKLCERLIREMEHRRRAEAMLVLDVRKLVRGGLEGEMRDLGKEVCRITAAGDGAVRVAMLLRQPDGRVMVSGSVGLDDLSVQALNNWSENGGWRRRKGALERHAGAEIKVRLDRRSRASGGLSLMPCQDAEVFPMWASTGEMLGALALGVQRGQTEVRGLPARSMVDRLGRELEEMLRRTGGLVDHRVDRTELPERCRAGRVSAAHGLATAASVGAGTRPTP